MHAEVLVELKGLDQTFTYNIPNNLINDIKVGIRVKVPFNNKILEGFVLSINNSKVDYELKDIIELVDIIPVLTDDIIDLGNYISKKYLVNKITSYQTMLPKALKASNKTNINKKYVTYLELLDNNYIGKTNTQKEILELFKINSNVLKKEASSISVSSTKTLITNKIIKEIKQETYRINNNVNKIKVDIKLTEEQINAINKVDINTFKPYLLHGVTGSGKTEVYINLIKKVIDKNRTAILLVPEISLTPQLLNIFRSRFGNIAVLHSRLSDGEKYDEYRKILNNEVSIVIGARSAVFAPLKNLGIIIIDEEHTENYKQENNPKYNAIEVSLYRGKKNNIPVILGSATPSIESYTRAKLNVYELIEMKNRINKTMPEIQLVDMKTEIKRGNKYFSSILKSEIQKRLDNNEQVILFLNRRGYSTIVTCHNCGFTVKCPNCDIPLTYHKNTDNLRCHYCNYTVNNLSVCPECNSKDINQFGLGTEKLEQVVLNTFEKAKTLRMDLDTTSKKNGHEEIINAFKDKDYNILIGTQMIVKGLDFPSVTLVGVINGDSSLNIPDFRSSERTFDLLSQVSGRSGRSNLKGKVIIQGFNIDHYSIQYASKNDYIGFYNEEIKIRKSLNYPPYSSICLIEVKNKDYDKVITESKKIVNYLKSNIKNVLGPSMEGKKNNIYKMQIIIKYKSIKDIIDYITFINNKYRNSNITVDINFNPLRF